MNIYLQERSNEIGMGSIEGLLMDGEHRALFDDKEVLQYVQIILHSHDTIPILDSEPPTKHTDALSAL